MSFKNVRDVAASDIPDFHYTVSGTGSQIGGSRVRCADVNGRVVGSGYSPDGLHRFRHGIQ